MVIVSAPVRQGKRPKIVIICSSSLSRGSDGNLPQITARLNVFFFLNSKKGSFSKKKALCVPVNCFSLLNSL